MSDEINGNGAGDETELDRVLEESIASVKAGQTLETAPSNQPAAKGPTGAADLAPTGAAEAAGATGATGEAPTGEASPTGATGEPGESDFRIPNKGKWESDEAYEKRVELFDLVKRRRAATTPEAKAKLSEDIKKAKSDLKTLSGTERFIPPKTETGAPGATGEADAELAADQERLRQLGGATKEDVQAMLAQTRHEEAVRSDLQRFVDKHSELKDEDVREVFFDFVDNNYVWQGKSGKDLSSVLEMAHENMFRPSESVQDRVLRAAGVEKKVGAMQFPGGTGGKQGHSPEMQKSIDELKATGMSEEKAIELLSDQ